MSRKQLSKDRLFVALGVGLSIVATIVSIKSCDEAQRSRRLAEKSFASEHDEKLVISPSLWLASDSGYIYFMSDAGDTGATDIPVALRILFTNVSRQPVTISEIDYRLFLDSLDSHSIEFTPAGPLSARAKQLPLRLDIGEPRAFYDTLGLIFEWNLKPFHFDNETPNKQWRELPSYLFFMLVYLYEHGNIQLHDSVLDRTQAAVEAANAYTGYLEITVKTARQTEYVCQAWCMQHGYRVYHDGLIVSEK